MGTEITPARIAQILDAFVNGKGGKYDWSDFTDYEIEDPALERIRRQCESLADLYPSNEGHWCNDQGLEELRAISKRLKEGVV